MIARALFFYISNSIKNRLLVRVRRMREPRYLIGGIAGALYFYFYLFRFVHHNASAAMAAGAPAQRSLVESLYALALFVAFLLMWILPHSRAAVSFSEAEVAFLFPAPVTRRELINFKLLRLQAGILFSSFFMAIIGRFGGGIFYIRWVGWWVILAVFNLHLLGSSFAITMLMDRGLSNWRRRALFLGVIALGVVGLGGWLVHAFPPPPDLSNGPDAANALLHYLNHALESGPLPWLLYPFKLLTAPFLARTPEAFLAALPGAFALLALHYLWVIRSNVAFEEASVEASRKTAEKLAARRAGNWQGARAPKNASRAPFRLAATGFPPIALVWKNLIAAGHLVTVRFWIMLGWLIFAACMVFRSQVGNGAEIALTSTIVALLVFSLLLGPNILRNDLRQDLPMADMLKTLPLPGWQIVLGEVLAPVSILAAGQWLLLLMALVCCPAEWQHHPLPLLLRLGCFAGIALLLPAIDFASLLIRNLAVLTFPAWFQLGKEGPRGFENTGQQLILVLGLTVTLALALLPPAVVFLVAWLAAMWLYGTGLAIVAASLAAFAALALEVGLAVRFLGLLFDRFDLSKEVMSAD